MMREKGLYPNVDFSSASTYYMMGIRLISIRQFAAVPLRLRGQSSKYADNKLIRPRAEYIGARDSHYIPISQR